MTAAAQPSKQRWKRMQRGMTPWWLLSAPLVILGVLFVAPLVAIIVIRRHATELERWLSTRWEQLLGFGQAALAGITGSVGLVLLIIGVTGLLAA